jgi:hypothetical protein
MGVGGILAWSWYAALGEIRATTILQPVGADGNAAFRRTFSRGRAPSDESAYHEVACARRARAEGDDLGSVRHVERDQAIDKLKTCAAVEVMQKLLSPPSDIEVSPQVWTNTVLLALIKMRQTPFSGTEEDLMAEIELFLQDPVNQAKLKRALVRSPHRDATHRNRRCDQESQRAEGAIVQTNR